VSHTHTAGIQRPHVEDIYTLHLAHDLQTLQTSRLLEIGGDGARCGAWREEVVLVFDLCYAPTSAFCTLGRCGGIVWKAYALAA